MRKLFALALFISCFQNSVAQFSTTWMTENEGSSESNQITIPINDQFNYNFNVDWGDGSSDESVTGTITHTYASPGTYSVDISGEFPAINFSGGGDAKKIISVDKWGDIEWQSFRYAFWGCSELSINADDAPDLSKVTDMKGMFFEASNLSGDLNNWDVSSIEDFSLMFQEATNFNGDISSWNTMAAIDMSDMFRKATEFNQDISQWDVSKVQNMSRMFDEAQSFDQALRSWNTSEVLNMNQMFLNASAFNQDISNWDVGMVDNMSGMFWGATSFNQPLNTWDVSRVIQFQYMFSNASSFNQDISNWDVSLATNMSWMFSGATSFDQDLGAWNVGNVSNMEAMFSYSYFNQDISGWDVSNVQIMESMFLSDSVFNQDLNDWDVSSLGTTANMFAAAVSFNGKIENWNTSMLQSTSGMFALASSFNQDIGQWDMSSVQTMNSMFQGATSFNQDIGAWDVGKVITMSTMFFEAKGFDQDISGWNVSSVITMGNMLTESGMSKGNYELMLEGWSNLELQSFVSLGALGIYYCASSEARNKLIEEFRWIIRDDGQQCDRTDILKVEFDDQVSVEINDNSSSVEVLLAPGIDLMALSPAVLEIAEDATISPDPSEVRDFNQMLTYTVLAEDKVTSRNWSFSVKNASSETDIISFSFSEETGAATINTTDHTVIIEVVNGTDLSSLMPTIGLSDGATISPESGVARDFSSSVSYTVTAEDGTTTQDWAVTVTEAPSDATDITSFVLAEETGSATINTTDHTVSIEVVRGTDLSALTPTIGLSEGATISPESGVARDFSSSVSYMVTAEDGTTTQDWVVIVTEEPSDATDITSFVLAEETGPATINASDHTISIEVVHGTDLSSLTPTIGLSEGAAISPESGVARDFSSSVSYTVTAEDGTTTQDWAVIVTEAPSDATDITSFVLAEETGPATINASDHTISIEVVHGTDLSSLTPTIGLSEGATISPESGVARDFSSSVSYTVTAEDGTTTQDWSVTVTEAPSDATDITSFVLAEETGPATINASDHTINIEVVHGTDLSSLTPTIGLSEGAAISPESGVARDFSSSVSYMVTAEDGTTTQDWAVIVTEAPSDATDITSFVLAEETGLATINASDHTISIEVVHGTDLSSLTPTIGLSEGATISPESGVARDFSSSVSYTVTAEDGTTTQDWSVTVTEAPSDATDITSFVLAEENGPATINASEHTISIEVVHGTDLSSLTPRIGLSVGAAISPESGVARDFSSSVSYTVTAEDGTTTQDWAVTVTEAPSDATDITSFVLAEETGPATINASEHTISIEVVHGTDLSSLTPTIGLSEGATISPESGVARDFSSSVSYTVTAEDGTTTQDWSVTVTEAPSDATDITSFVLAEENGPATINATNHTINIEVVHGTDLSSLTPTIGLSEEATISPESGMPQDFSTTVTYTVTAEDGTTTQDWMVTVTEALSTETDILAFMLVEQTGPAMINDMDHTIFVEVDRSTDLSSLTPTIGISDGATISPEAMEAQDFSDAVTYIITAEDGATSQDWVVTVMEEEALSTSTIATVQVYPNPATEELIVDFAHETEGSKLILLDASGRQILQVNSELQDQVILDVRELQSGIYFLQVQGREDLSTYRFIKE